MARGLQARLSSPRRTKAMADFDPTQTLAPMDGSVFSSAIGSRTGRFAPLSHTRLNAASGEAADSLGSVAWYVAGGRGVSQTGRTHLQELPRMQG